MSPNRMGKAALPRMMLLVPKQNMFSPPPLPAETLLFQTKTPVCTKEGVIFDILNIMPYVRKHKRNPVTGEALAPKDLVRLNVSKNADGKWHCPVTFKVRPARLFRRVTHPPTPPERDFGSEESIYLSFSPVCRYNPSLETFRPVQGFSGNGTVPRVVSAVHRTRHHPPLRNRRVAHIHR